MVDVVPGKTVRRGRGRASVAFPSVSLEDFLSLISANPVFGSNLSSDVLKPCCTEYFCFLDLTSRTDVLEMTFLY